MSTNFYARKTPEPPCACCGRQDPPIEWHIGQRASGWTFALHVEMEQPGFPKNWDDWKRLLESGEWTIWDEYETQYTLEEFLPNLNGCAGLFGKVRRRSRGRPGGPGYDLFEGEFS